ncbi:MAG: DUF2752 domain-containing protein [Tannerella sp.]|jgi:hypothetical protein|nr:DUF2752 domain-containing protein [Tannerella sp.]
MRSRPVIKLLIGLVLIITISAGVYLYSGYNPEDSGLFPKCPVYMLTGYKCPGCGSQRAFHHLFNGNFRAAFVYNPVMLVLIPYILLGIFIEYVASQQWRTVSHIRRIFFGKEAVLILAAVIALYTILRNTT